MKKLQAFFLLVASLMMTSSVFAQDKIPVKMAHPPLALHELPLLMASQLGLFAAEGLTVSHVFVTGGNEAAAALIAGNVEILVRPFAAIVRCSSHNGAETC
jgi:ABC-type nitrate/sulfonate/bicarbonate transport system substrate-binding protein